MLKVLDNLKQINLLGVEGQRVAGARADIAGRRQMKGQMASGIGSMIGSLIAGS